MNWYAVQTKPNQEALAHVFLEKLDVEIFFPKIIQNKPIRGKRRSLIRPLFPGYLFARFCFETHYRAVNFAQGVRKLVCFGEVPARVDDEIINSIQSKLQGGFVTVQPSVLTRGNLVRIHSGPLCGLEAVFDREMDDQQRVVLLLQAMSYQARVVVDFEQIAPL